MAARTDGEFTDQTSDEETMPESCFNWRTSKYVPKHLYKYWSQRRNIFSRFDEDIWMTEDSFFGTTPESVARKVASEIATYAPKQKTVMVDAFSGVGGNAIAFALSNRWEQIFAIEKDPTTMKCAKHNARIYGVEKKIFWILSDVFEFLKAPMKSYGRKIVIHASPPWGGPGYGDAEVFNLKTMEPYNLGQLYSHFTRITREIALYLPRTSDLNQLAELAVGDEHFEVVHYCIRGASKAICFYSGALAAQLPAS